MNELGWLEASEQVTVLESLAGQVDVEASRARAVAYGRALGRRARYFT